MHTKLSVVIVNLLVFNILSFYLFSMLRQVCAPSLNCVRDAGKSETMNYFVAGLCNEPAPAFALISEPPGLLLDGGVTYVEAPRYFGDYYQQAALAILDDVEAHGYRKVRVFAISAGCHVTDLLNRAALDLPNTAFGRSNAPRFRDLARQTGFAFYDINPCFCRDCYQPAMRAKLWPALIGCNLVAAGLGWGNILPLVVKDGDRFTSAHVVGLHGNTLLAGVSPDSHEFPLTRAVILSTRDEFLDNQKIEELYSESQADFYYVDSAHGRTVVEASAYLAAFEQILEKEAP